MTLRLLPQQDKQNADRHPIEAATDRRADTKAAKFRQAVQDEASHLVVADSHSNRDEQPATFRWSGYQPQK